MIEEELEPYNKPFLKSFRLKRFWRVLLYDLGFAIVVSVVLKLFLVMMRREVLRLPDPSLLFTVGASAEQVGVFDQFFSSLLLLAIAGLLHPIIAEIAMALSSITVVSNANLLRRKRI